MMRNNEHNLGVGTDMSLFEKPQTSEFHSRTVYFPLAEPVTVTMPAVRSLPSGRLRYAQANYRIDGVRVEHERGEQPVAEIQTIKVTVKGKRVGHSSYINKIQSWDLPRLSGDDQALISQMKHEALEQYSQIFPLAP
jgi:hypothetical protein